MYVYKSSSHLHATHGLLLLQHLLVQLFPRLLAPHQKDKQRGSHDEHAVEDERAMHVERWVRVVVRAQGALHWKEFNIFVCVFCETEGSAPRTNVTAIALPLMKGLHLKKVFLCT
jgi:hypothetical protein